MCIRDSDSGKFLPEYLKKNVFDKDPFETIDQNGVGKLITMACNLGKQTRPDIKLGICGEHGGDVYKRQVLPSRLKHVINTMLMVRKFPKKLRHKF